ncbi:MAG: (Fe-S)-binding protein [Candidatus Aminicenantes bacterium]|nr:(Fe-S)-binding protein [Candidatus Aminicenantes bacterium]
MPGTIELIKYTSPMLEIAQAVVEAKGEELKKCYQCGTCTAVCPWGNLIDFNPRQFIEEIRLGFEGFEENSWKCVNCRLCQDKCPNQIDIPQLFQSVRSILLAWQSCPSELNFALAGIRSQGNPWQEDKEKRGEWAKDVALPEFTPGTEYLFFNCCANDYDTRNQAIAEAAVEILNTAGLNFGYLGNKATCCGDMAYTAGENEIFQSTSAKNMQTFTELQVEKILTLSPHCLNAFKNRYEFEKNRPTSTHLVETYSELVKNEILKPQFEVNAKVTYHDPCYLGRYNGIFDAPRDILQAIPGVELIEMNHNREHSFCCGGGGGGAWLDTVKGERLGDLRVLEAVEASAEVIVTACPYCVQMLEASIVGLGIEDKIKVMEISEILLSSLKQEEK